jgi:serine/threonine-protein kinase
MSPEQFTGKALDARSDVYSLAVMTYEMVTGRLPFEANTPWQWATEHMMSQPIPFEATPTASQIPASMRAAILRALSKNKEDRQSSVTQFYEELAGAGASQTAAAATTGTTAMAAPPVFDAPAGPPKTAAMAAPIASGPSTAQAVARAVPIPEPRRRGGNKGLIIGLVSVGGVLLVGMAVVAARSMKQPDESPPPAAPAAPPPATVKPEAPPPTAEAPAETAEPAGTGTAPVTHPATAGGTKPSTATQPTHTSAAPVTTPKPPATTPPPAGGNACAACIAAAQSGNFSAAASAYNSCTEAGPKAQCSGIVKGRAQSAVQTEAFNGNCAKAKAMAAAAQSMGVPGGAFAKALAACK